MRSTIAERGYGTGPCDGLDPDCQGSCPGKARRTPEGAAMCPSRRGSPDLSETPLGILAPSFTASSQTPRYLERFREEFTRKKIVPPSVGKVYQISCGKGRKGSNLLLTNQSLNFLYVFLKPALRLHLRPHSVTGPTHRSVTPHSEPLRYFLQRHITQLPLAGASSVHDMIERCGKLNAKRTRH